VKLMESVHAVATEKRDTYWIKRFIDYHGKRHPATMGKEEIEGFLTDLAVGRRPWAGSQ
jgi:hypothetical protein